MRIMEWAGRGWVFALVVAATFAAAPANANAQELSEKATLTFMEYAWTLTPERFTKPNGETVLIDKSKRAEVTIPLDVAREVIRAGRLSAHAQACGLAQEQGENHSSLMRRQVQAKKWTPQQMVYINQLHLTVVMLLTGRIKLVEKADPKDGKAPDKEVVVAEEPEKAAQTCSAEQKEKVKELIAAYVKTGPLAANAPPAAAAGAAPAAVPAAATTVDKAPAAK
jgi:hypothetical protein